MTKHRGICVSVILPVYNGQKTIGPAVASVLAQTMAALELIIINDGSTDATLDLLFKIDDPRVRIFSFPRAGVSTSRNRGIAKAQGAYIAFIDADDLWAENKLEKQVAALKSHPGAQVAYCWVDYIDHKGHYLFSDGRPQFSGDVYEALLTGNFIDSGSTVLISRDVLAKTSGFEDSLSCFEDWDLYVRLAQSYRFVPVPCVLVFYRLHPGTLTTRNMQMETDYLCFLDRAFSGVPAHLVELKAKNRANTYLYLTGKATQHLPTREKSVRALCFFAKAVRARPKALWQPDPKFWVAKAVAKALLCLVLPRGIVQKIADMYDRGCRLNAQAAQDGLVNR